MISEGQRLADAAAAFVGVPFRLHGREPAIGLDCIGLLLASLAASGQEPVSPRGYRLRNSDPGRWFSCAHRSGLVDVVGSIEAGDVLLVSPGPGQQHILIVETDRTAIHAHAGLRRVVRQRIEFPAERLAHWRLKPTS